MNPYKQWTASERGKSLRETNRLIKAGIISKPKKCKRCGTTRNVRYHNNDYSDPMKYLEPLCFRCHLKEHRQRRNNQLDLWKEDGHEKLLSEGPGS